MPAPPPGINTHIHLPPNFSAFESVEQAVELARAEGLVLLGTSNYYDFRIYREFERQCGDAGIRPLFGIEIILLDPELQSSGMKINDPGNPGKMYLCGKGLGLWREPSAAAAAVIGRIRAADDLRMRRMTEKLAATFAENGLPDVPAEASIRATVARRAGVPETCVTLQERHLAEAFQESLFRARTGGAREAALASLTGQTPRPAEDPVAVQGALRTHLMKTGRPAYEEERFISFDEAFGLVLELGGIPCYPVLADGASPLCGFETPVENLIERLRSRRLHCAEWIPTRNRAELLAAYVPALRRAGLAQTAGTEHNTSELGPLRPACAGGAAVPEPVRAIFEEGACVAAAHQHCVERGEPGFVDATGRPHSGFTDAESRIRHFAALGAELLSLGRA